MIPLSADALITFHGDSLGSLVGLTIIAFFLLFTLAYYPVSPEKRVLRSMFALNLVLFVYLLGVAFYPSGRTVESVDFWTRVCYSGVALIAPTFTQFVNVLMGKVQKKTTLALLAISLAWVAAIWLSEALVTRELRPLVGLEHPSMLKGPGLILMLVYVYGIVGWWIWRLIGFYRSDRAFRTVGLSLLIGFILWFLVSVLDGMVAARLLKGIPPVGWAGPCLMVLMMGIFYARMMTNSNQALAKAVAEKEQIYQQMIRDDLTGAFSRNYLTTVLDEILRFSPELVPALHSLLFIDMDNLKVINDRLGHAVGDDALKQAVAVFQTACRKSDVVARLGGDEFVVLLRDCPRDHALQIAGQILIKFQLQVAGLNSVQPGLSIGVVASTDWNAQAEEAIRMADETMYFAKTHGKNRIAWFDGEKICMDAPAAGVEATDVKALNF